MSPRTRHADHELWAVPSRDFFKVMLDKPRQSPVLSVALGSPEPAPAGVAA